MLPESSPQLTLADSFGKVPPPVPINLMGQHFRTSSQRPQFLFNGIAWLQTTSCIQLVKSRRGGTITWPFQTMMTLNRTVTTTPTQPRLTKTATKKTRTEIFASSAESVGDFRASAGRLAEEMVKLPATGIERAL